MLEAVEKHNTLNQKLFSGMDLKSEVRKKIQEVVNEFLRILAEDEILLKVRDVILTGSNASYNYTDTSDIDVHILADTKSLDDPKKLYTKLYNAYRRIFESKYDITFYGIPVELYVETEDNPVVSNGIYSIMYDQWIKKPVDAVIPAIDQKVIDEAAQPWIEEANSLIARAEDEENPTTEQEIDNYITKLYEFRQTGIYHTAGSEFSTENLVFKEVRSAGLLDELKKLKNKIIEKSLSLESLKEDENTRFYLTEPERRDYQVKIAQLTHNQPIIQRNGIFEIYNVKEADVDYIITILKREP